MKIDYSLSLLSVLIVLISTDNKNAVNADATYLGCFADKEGERDLSARWIWLPRKMTISNCEDLCENFPFFSLQAGDHCFCGVSHGKHGKARNDECNSKCHGNKNQICGGQFKNSVYKHEPRYSASVTFYIGCYKDTADRDLKGKEVHLANTLTVEKCDQVCHGFPYFSLQAGAFCFCGTQYGKHGFTYDSECDFKCDGDKNQVCGAGWRNSVYQHPVRFGKVTYIGCFMEKQGERDIDQSFTFLSHPITMEKCAEHCKHFRYFAIQSAHECRCGTEYKKENVVSESECGKCSGNQDQYCGAGFRNSIYKYPQQVGTATYIGCFMDAGDRDLDESFTFISNPVTVEKCAEHCKNFPYFAIQSAHECRCGKQYGKHGEVPDSDCGKCAGNQNQFCGAGFRNSIYQKTA